MRRATLFAFAILTALDARAARAEEGPADPIDSALERRISFQFVESPLSDVLVFFRQSLGIPIVLDPNASDDRVSLSVRDLAVRQALELILSPRGLAHRVEDGVLFVSDRTLVRSREAVLAVYDVLDLVSPVEDYPGSALAPPATSDFGTTFSEEAGTEAFDADHLVEFLQRRVEPESWGENGFRMAIVAGGILVVRHVPQAHERIATLLADIRRSEARLVHVTATALAVPESVLAEIQSRAKGAALFVDDETRKSLAERSTRIDDISLVAFDSQRVHARSALSIPHVQDYDVQVAQYAAGADPVVARAILGMALDVRAVLGPSAKSVAVELAVELARPLGEFEERPATDSAAQDGQGPAIGQGSAVMLARISTMSVKTLVRIGRGQAAIFVSTSPIAPEGTVVVLVVTARPLD